MIKVGLLGLGAVGSLICATAARRPEDGIDVVVALVRDLGKTRSTASIPLVADVDQLLAARPDVVVECAGHAAASAYVPVILRAGVDVLMLSGGALADDGVLSDVRRASEHGGGVLRLVAGAIGGLDTIGAAGLEGLERVAHTIRKPARALLPPDEAAALREERVLYQGTAREGVKRFPESANSVTAVSLAGLGLDATEMRVVADPKIDRNRHVIEVHGPFGSLRVEQENVAMATNPRTSRITAMSAYHGILDRSATLRVG